MKNTKRRLKNQLLYRYKNLREHPQRYIYNFLELRQLIDARWASSLQMDKDIIEEALLEDKIELNWEDEKKLYEDHKNKFGVRERTTIILVEYIKSLHDDIVETGRNYLKPNEKSQGHLSPLQVDDTNTIEKVIRIAVQDIPQHVK